MASSVDFVNYVCGQIGGAGEITARKMFGEYGVYCNGKVVGVICQNQLFVKWTQAGAALLDGCALAAPYTGAKPHFLIDCLENRPLMERLISATWEQLPQPRPKRNRGKG